MHEEGTEFRRLAAIMFTDMVGYSALAQRNEALALELLEAHRRLLRPIFPKHQGQEIKTTGDGFLVEFASALAAVHCGIEIQAALADRNAREPPDRQVRIRIGIHVGDIVRREGDVVGDGVNIAARIEPLAEPGGICISEDVARQIQNKIDLSLVRLGPGELKNIQLSVVIYKLLLTLDAGRGAQFGPPVQSWQKQLRGLAAPAAVALLVFFAGGLAFWAFLSWQGRARLPTQPSIAVLPFVNMSADKENEYLCDGLTEELLNALAREKGLWVPARTSVFAFKGKSQDIQKIGQQLRVRTLLEGSVRKSGGKLRITVQLIKVSDGYHLWSETYERDTGDLFALQTDITRRVTEALKDPLTGGDEWGGLTALHANVAER